MEAVILDKYANLMSCHVGSLSLSWIFIIDGHKEQNKTLSQCSVLFKKCCSVVNNKKTKCVYLHCCSLSILHFTLTMMHSLSA